MVPCYALLGIILFILKGEIFMIDTHYDLLTLLYIESLNNDYSYTEEFKKNFNKNNVTGIFANLYFMDKNEILESYFNVIYVGPNIYGVKLGAKYYFNKELSEMTLAECAFLAGLNNSPNSYNPFAGKDNVELIKKRTKLGIKVKILIKVLDLGKKRLN